MSPQDHIEELEARLLEYHKQLEDVIIQRDRLTLDAAWGVHYALFNTLGIFGIIYAASRLLPYGQLIAGSVTVVGLLVAPLVIDMRSNGGRLKEVERLARLPEWAARG